MTPHTVERGMDSWPAGIWNYDGGWAIHKGGNFVMYPAMLREGSVGFTIFRSHGRKAQWVLGYMDSNNYLLFEIDGKDFHRKEVRNGVVTELAVKPHQAGQGAFSIQVDVSPRRIVHSIYIDNRWRLLDDWNQSGGQFTGGQFGFLISGNDEIGLSNFHFSDQTGSR
jgi:hypothetical protein